jgi:tRNA uridine 5-carbamoylmethylation protein Kti12
MLGGKKRPVNKQTPIESASTDPLQSSSTTIDGDVSISNQQTIKAQADFLDKNLKCMNSLIELASQSNRNIIIDQPNIYKSTRRRKMKLFDDYKKICVVIVTPDEDHCQFMNKKSDQESFITIMNDMKGKNLNYYLNSKL